TGRPTARAALSEHDSKTLLARYGIPTNREILVADGPGAARAAEELGFPVVLKLCGDTIVHKTERDLVRLGLADAAEVRAAAGELLRLRRPEDSDVELLVAEQVRGRRELVAGMVRDPAFGPCVMLGLGGILAEGLGDVVFATAPLSTSEGRRMIAQLRTHRLFLEPFRGEPALDVEALGRILLGLARLALERADVLSVDVNPLVVRGALPIAVDALVILDPAGERPASPPPAPRPPPVVLERLRHGARARPRHDCGPARHPPRRSERPGRHLHRRVDVRPDGRAVSAAGTDLRRQPEWKRPLVAAQLCGADGDRGEQGRFHRQRRPDDAGRLPRVLRGRPRDRRRARLPRGRGRRTRLRERRPRPPPRHTPA